MGVKDMLEKLKAVLHAGEAKKAKETSRINLDAELEAVRAALDAERTAKEAEERKAAVAAGEE